MKDADLIFLGARNRFESLDSGELPFERTRFLETGAVHDFCGSKDPSNATRQPDFSVGTPADRAQQLVVRYSWGHYILFLAQYLV